MLCRSPPPLQICTTNCVLKSFNITEMSKEDATFSVPFTIKVTRNDYVHALVGFFDVNFQACHKPISFSTGPAARATHWKQTVFYLEDTLTVSLVHWRGRTGSCGTCGRHKVH